MRVHTVGEIIEWRGPAPFYFVDLPEDASAEIADVARSLTYGWGVVPVEVTLNSVVFTTSLFPKDGAYLVPLRAAVRAEAAVECGDVVEIDVLLGG